MSSAGPPVTSQSEYEFSSLRDDMLVKCEEYKQTYSKASCAWAGSILIKILTVTETTMGQDHHRLGRWEVECCSAVSAGS